MAFRHPGTLMSPAMTFSLHQDKESDPIRKTAYEKLLKECPIEYKSQAIEIVDIGWGGKGSGHDECTKDGEMAYRAALLYWCTLDDRYGYLVIDILKSWANVNKVFKGDNAPLEASWSVCAMARAGELIKYAKSERLRTTWKINEPIFLKWLDNVIIPCLKTKSIWDWKPKGNWHFSIICARAQIAILRDDISEWKWCIETYKTTLQDTICFGHPCQISETKRDVTHAQFQLGGIIQMPEMALHQGNSTLFDPRLKDVFEYHASIMMGNLPEGLSKNDIKTPYGLWYEPVWEIAFAHFKGRKGLLMPNTEQYLQKIRPERICFHWGGGTLTHYNRYS